MMPHFAIALSACFLVGSLALSVQKDNTDSSLTSLHDQLFSDGKKPPLEAINTLLGYQDLFSHHLRLENRSALDDTMKRLAEMDSEFKDFDVESLSWDSINAMFDACGEIKGGVHTWSEVLQAAGPIQGLLGKGKGISFATILGDILLMRGDRKSNAKAITNKELLWAQLDGTCKALTAQAFLLSKNNTKEWDTPKEFTFPVMVGKILPVQDEYDEVMQKAGDSSDHYFSALSAVSERFCQEVENAEYTKWRTHDEGVKKAVNIISTVGLASSVLKATIGLWPLGHPHPFPVAR